MHEDPRKGQPSPTPTGKLEAGRAGEPQAPRDSARIAKVLARAGLCSRRDAEAWISEGRVAVEGVTLTSAAVTVTPHDHITVDGEPLAEPSRTRLFLFHKPRGLVTTARDPQARPTIFDHLRTHWRDGPRVVSVGRLDINSEGLLLLTNDGGLARVLELPSTGWIRRYRVRANGTATQAQLDGLREGLTIDGVRYAGIGAVLDRVQGSNCWLTMALREGKNREIKRVLEHLGLRVNRLIRLSFGPFQLGDLPEGAVKEVPTRVLRDQLGRELAKAASADFSSPPRGEKEAPVRDLAKRRRVFVSPEAPSHAAGSARSPRAVEPQARASKRPKPRPRKHVSVLRAEENRRGTERKRMLRSQTEDRSGRTVEVERLVGAAGADQKQARRGARDRPPSGERASKPKQRHKDRLEQRPRDASNGRAFPGGGERGGGANQRGRSRTS